VDMGTLPVGFLCFKIHTHTLGVFRNQVPDTCGFLGSQVQSGTDLGSLKLHCQVLASFETGSCVSVTNGLCDFSTTAN